MALSAPPPSSSSLPSASSAAAAAASFSTAPSILPLSVPEPHEAQPLVAEGPDEDISLAVSLVEAFNCEGCAKNMLELRELKRVYDELDTRFKKSGEKNRKLLADWQATKEATTHGLRASLRAMRAAQEAGSTQTDTAYRHPTWVSQKSAEGAERLR